MPVYSVTFGRIAICKAEIEAESEQEAEELLYELDDDEIAEMGSSELEILETELVTTAERMKAEKAVSELLDAFLKTTVDERNRILGYSTKE